MIQYNFTIIIPHKNIPQLLQRCLDSIPESDDIQVVVVDDNSNPEKVDFKNFPGLNRKNTEVYFTKEGKGAGYARNIGLKHAKGKWLLFADADDFFSPQINEIIKSYIDSDFDLIVFDTFSVLSDTLQKTEKREDIIDLYLKTLDENILRYVSHCVWGKMFKRQIVINNNIHCDEVPASNDVLFAGLMGIYASKIIFDKRIGYCCTVRSGSICTKLSAENIHARIYVAKKFNLILKQHQIPTKYWMNLLGPVISLYKINKSTCIKSLIQYLNITPLSRLKQDIIQSGNRYILRLLKKNKDKEMRSIQKYYK